MKLYAYTFLAVIFLVAGCQKKNSQNTQETSPKHDVVFLHYWTDALSGGIDEMVEVYNRDHPLTHVRAKGFEHEAFKTGIKVMLAGGNPPDLFSYWAGSRTAYLAKKNYLEPLDSLWSQEHLDKRFPQSVQEACTYEGHRYIVPVTQHMIGFFYNVRVFAAAGLNPPKTWDDFQRVCTVLSDRGITPVALGARDNWPAQFWFDYILLRTAGPDYRARLVEGRASYVDTEVVHAVDIWATMLEKKWFNSDATMLDWSDAANMVADGHAGMTLMGTWIIGMYEGQKHLAEGVDFDFFPFPQMKPGVERAALGGLDAMLVPREGNTVQAKQVVTYFAAADVLTIVPPSNIHS